MYFCAEVRRLHEAQGYIFALSLLWDNWPPGPVNWRTSFGTVLEGEHRKSRTFITLQYELSESTLSHVDISIVPELATFALSSRPYKLGGESYLST